MESETKPIDRGEVRDVLEQIRSLSPNLTRSTKLVADAVLADPHAVVWMSAEKLAHRSGTSVGSVVRFCYALGFPGFQDFKFQFSNHLPQTPLLQEISRRTTPKGAIETTLESSLKSLATTVTSIEQEAVEEAAVLLSTAARILILASGPSQPLAMTLGQWFSRNKYTVAYPVDLETQLAIADGLGPGTVCIGISHSGTTENTLRPVLAAAQRGAATIALTSFSNSDIVKACDVTIVAGAPATDYHSDDTSSRPVHLAVINALTARISELSGGLGA